MTKRCSRCRVDKPYEDFHRSKQTKTGCQPACKLCTTEQQREWRSVNRARSNEIRRESRLRTMYGLETDDFLALRDRQGDRCAICAETFVETPRVDHCHETGLIRGLLCNNCNRGIGLLQDSPVVVSSALVYLQACQS